MQVGSNDQPKVRVLVTERSSLVRSRLEEMLLHDKDALLVGRDIAGLPALTQVKQTKPNIVVLDLGIGETESITEISSIKGIDKGIIVVILSTIASVKLRDQCERAGADYFFDKTCEFEKLHGVIHWLNKNQPGAKSA